MWIDGRQWQRVPENHPCIEPREGPPMRRDKWTLVATGFAAMSLIAGILPFSVRSAAADQIGFAVDNTTNLFSVDLTTATATPIGNTGQFLQGLAFSPAGSLFGTDYQGNLYSVSKTTGAATFIGSTGLGDIEGLTFRGSTLIGTNFSNLGGPTTLSAIDTTTAYPRRSPAFRRAQCARWHW